MKKCIYCGNEFEAKHPSQRYCSEECHRKVKNLAAMKKSRGDKERICNLCGSELPKFKAKYCSDKCKNRAHAISEGKCLDHGLLTKQCVVCGKEFQTFKSRKITCSDECRRNNSGKPRPYDSEKEHEKYARKHPNARTQAEVLAEYALKREQKKKEIAERQAAREAEWAANRETKAKKKQQNIDYWLNYEAEHICVECGKHYTAHYPKSKYCSDACKRRKYKKRRRYKGITIDSDISLFKLAERDHNQCQICGLFVNWDDYIKTEATIICGDMYPSIDHIRPISLGGLHSWDNVQLAHRGCNTRKCNRYIG